MKLNRYALTVIVTALCMAFGSPSSAGVSGIFWTDNGTNKIQRADGNGTNVQDLITGLSRPAGIAVDQASGKLFWTDLGQFPCIASAGLRSANLDGSGVQSHLVGSPFFGMQGVAVDSVAGKVYFGPTHRFFCGDAARIRNINVDGTGVQVLVTNSVGFFPGGLAVDVAGGKMYWGDSSSGSIRRANLNGTGVQTIISSGVGTPRGMAVDSAGGKLYFSTGFSGQIARVNLNGSGLQILVSGLSFPWGVALDVPGNRVYWADINSNKIQSANLDGTNVQDVITGLGDPQGIALLTGINVPVDINPTSCPNPLNVKSKGVLPVAILSTVNFDATQVDVTTVTLEGVSPLRSNLEDVATPFDPFTGKENALDCNEDAGDGFTDLTLKFDRQAVVGALGPVNDGDVIALRLEGALLDGTPIEGEDVIVIKKKK